jgi:D-alanine-D-alanine ligase
VVAELGLPLIVKPPLEGSTIGITKVTRAEDFKVAVDLAHKYDKLVLAEQFISGREFSVPLLGSGPAARALPIIEIVAPEGNYDYQNKYFTDDTTYHCPAPLDAATTDAIQRHVEKAYRALGCEGWARIDVLLRESDNAPFLLEVNTSPGMTTHSLVPMAARAEGTSYEDLCVQILRSASLKVGQAGVK